MTWRSLLTFTSLLLPGCAAANSSNTSTASTPMFCYVGNYSSSYDFGDMSTMVLTKCGAGQSCQLSQEAWGCLDGGYSSVGACVDAGACNSSNGSFNPDCQTDLFWSCCADADGCNNNAGSAWLVSRTTRTAQPVTMVFTAMLLAFF
ncbi:unnamed protein product [Polarella glacialis]|uniref:Uncharacterized protein n=1 Tax=Polarella glacialis TaxID=89957 RepID=A0A813JRZ8_POLGL|nr:unnamed protein product [Polarella glacialis]